MSRVTLYKLYIRWEAEEDQPNVQLMDHNLVVWRSRHAGPDGRLGRAYPAEMSNAEKVIEGQVELLSKLSLQNSVDLI